MRRLFYSVRRFRIHLILMMFSLLSGETKTRFELFFSPLLVLAESYSFYDCYNIMQPYAIVISYGLGPKMRLHGH